MYVCMSHRILKYYVINDSFEYNGRELQLNSSFGKDILYNDPGADIL